MSDRPLSGGRAPAIRRPRRAIGLYHLRRAPLLFRVAGDPVVAPIEPVRSARAAQPMVVLCAANPWDGVRLHDRHLAEHLSAFVPVLYVDPPISRLTRRNHADRQVPDSADRLRRLSPTLAHLAPVALPGPTRRGMAIVTASLVRHAIRRAAATLDSEIGAVVSPWTLVPMLGRLGAPRNLYWAQDDFVGGAELFGLSPRRIARGERRQAAAADVVVAANPVVAAALRSRGFEPELIPFGADVELFATCDDVAPAADVSLPSPIVGCVGHLNAERIDVAVLEEIARRGSSLLLVGPFSGPSSAAAFAGLLERPNVQWVGPKPYDALPSYLRLIDVGVVPYADTAFNRGSFPLKTLECLAAGRPVVATDLPGVRWLATDLVAIATEPDAFADAVSASLHEPRTDAAVAARRSFAALHSWESRARRFAELLGVEAPCAIDT